jgi:hypothetical protein
MQDTKQSLRTTPIIKRMPIIFIVNGFPKSGKDTFAKILATSYQVANVSSVDEIKDIATIMGWDGEKTPESRKMLSDLKDFTTKYFDLPFNDMISKVGDNLNKDFIVLHIREPEEIDRMKKYLDTAGFFVYTVLIERKEIMTEKYTNHADENVYDANYDAIIFNNRSIEDFMERVLEFANVSIINPGIFNKVYTNENDKN